jgi:hypothetical protein
VLRQTCNVTEAARVAGVGRRTAYERREGDSAFASAWDEAGQEAADALEREAWRRGVEGTDKPVTYQGEITATYKEYSDRMHEMLLKARFGSEFDARLFDADPGARKWLHSRRHWQRLQQPKGEFHVDPAGTG